MAFTRGKMSKINDPDHEGRIAANDNARLNAFEELNQEVFGDKFSELRTVVANKTTAMPKAETDRLFLALIGINYNYDADALSWDIRKEKLGAMLPKQHKSRDKLLEDAQKMHVLNHAARLYEDTLGENSENKEKAPQAREYLLTRIKSYGNEFQANRIVEQFEAQIEQQKAAGLELE